MYDCSYTLGLSTLYVKPCQVGDGGGGGGGGGGRARPAAWSLITGTS